MRLGLVVNPIAGVGGPLARRGSDDLDDTEYLRLLPHARAMLRARSALDGLEEKSRIEIVTWAGPMGEEAARAAGFEPHVAGAAGGEITRAADTQRAVRTLCGDCDVLVFAGGDGTARDVLEAHDGRQLVLGIPAGVKMHSGVFATSPLAAAKVLDAIARGELVARRLGEVRDLDETALRAGDLRTRGHGVLPIPAEHRFVQAVKAAGREDVALVLEEIAAEICERMADGPLWLLGAGRTVQAIKRRLAPEDGGTLFGLDAAKDGSLVERDLDARRIEKLVASGPARLVISPTGGQGFLIGRGNQQLSPAALARLGAENIVVVATRSKLIGLAGRPLWVDSGDPEVDRMLAGLHEVVTGYDDAVAYRIAAAG